jgi:Xaa-Pro aminopeptidase
VSTCTTTKKIVCQVLEARSPVTLRKAIKNETELDGMREAHLRDAVAIVEFLTWLDEKARSPLPCHLTWGSYWAVRWKGIESVLAVKLPVC